MRCKAVASGVILSLVSTRLVTSLQSRSITYANPVIPKCDIALVPLEADLHFGARCYDLIEKRNDGVTLRLRNTDDLGYEARVEEEGFPARDGVCADERVGSCDGHAADSAT